MRIFKFSFLIIFLQNVWGDKGVIGRMEGNSKQWFAQARNGQCLYSFNLPLWNKKFASRTLDIDWINCATDTLYFYPGLPDKFKAIEFKGSNKVSKTRDGKFSIKCFEGFLDSEIGEFTWSTSRSDPLLILAQRGKGRKNVIGLDSQTYRYDLGQIMCAKIKAAKSYFESVVNNSNETN
jgi:hypothetical protein